MAFSCRICRILIRRGSSASPALTRMARSPPCATSPARWTSPRTPEGKWLRLKAGGVPIRVSATRVSAELFAILGAKPALGRTLRPGEDEALRDRYAILSHELWATRFARDEQIVGRFIDLDGVRREVVAVMPATFRFPSSRTQLWVPLGLDPADTSAHWAGDFMPVVGRLRAGASLAEGHAEVRAFQARIGTLFPWRMPADWNQDVAVIPLQEAAAAGVRRRLLILFAAVSLVLLIACANVANLSLSRAAARQREIAIRTALGASPRRIARQLLTESVMLASLGGGAGLLVAAQLLTILKFALPPDTPRLLEAHLSWRVLLFTAGVSILTGCAFGLAPMLNALRLRLRAVLDSGGRGSGPAVGGPLRATLTVAQIACAVPLVIAAALLLRNLWMLSHLDPGFNPDPIVTARISASGSRCETTERCLAFFRDVDDQSRTAPGVSGAALVNTLPLTGAVAKRSLEIEGFAVAAGRTAPLFWLHVITPAYFDVMNMQLASGRAFAREDQIGPPVAIVTAATARRFWDRENPIGRRVRFVGTNQWHTVVGVIADVRAYDMTRDVPNWIDGTIYVPYGPYATMEDGRVPTDMTLTLRTTLAGARVEGDAAAVGCRLGRRHRHRRRPSDAVHSRGRRGRAHRHNLAARDDGRVGAGAWLYRSLWRALVPGVASDQGPGHPRGARRRAPGRLLAGDQGRSVALWRRDRARHRRLVCPHAMAVERAARRESAGSSDVRGRARW